MAATDEELVARVLSADDRRAFAELVRRRQSGVRTLLRRLSAGDAALADDLAQETFVKAWRGLSVLGWPLGTLKTQPLAKEKLRRLLLAGEAEVTP